MKKWGSRQFLVLLVKVLFISAFVQKQAFADALNVSLRISVLAPACVINNNNPLSVSFGDVSIGNIDGINYQRQKLNYTLDCGSGSKNLKIRLNGNSSGFDNTLLATSNSNLAVAIYRDTTKMNLNDWSNFTYPGTRPDIYVVPARKTGSALSAGAFSASATLEVEYQ